MKKLLLTIACVGMASAAWAQQDMKVNIEKCWNATIQGLTTPYQGKTTVLFSNQNGEMYVGTNQSIIDLSQYKGVKIVLSEAVDGLQFKVGTSSDNAFGWPHITEKEQTLLFSNYSEKLGEATTVYCGIQSYSETAFEVTIENLYLIKTNDTEEQVSYTPWWGCSRVTYSGTIVLPGGKWATAAVVENVDLTKYEGYTVELEEAYNTADVLQIMANYKYNGESQYDVQADMTGKTTITVSFKNAVDKGVTTLENIGIQNKSESNSPVEATIKVKSVTLHAISSSTALPEIEKTSADLISTTYYSLTGVASKEPVKGINIVKRAFADGSIQVDKIMVK